MLSTYLGIDEGDALDMFAALKGPYLTHSYVQGLFMDYLDAAETAFANNAPMHEVRMYRERCVRAFLLFVVGCTIFSNKSSYYLDVVYIQYFADLSSVHEWNWGSAALGIPRDSDVSTPNMNIFEIYRVWAEEMDMRLIDANMRGQAVVNAWDCEPGYVLWFYKVSHPKMRPLEAPEDQPRPPELEVLLEESQQRHDPNPLGVCRSVRDEVQRALDAGEAEPGTPVH
ncbi:hypothetical protein TSUD_422380, partial [Trifolium subterraneum]